MKDPDDQALPFWSLKPWWCQPWTILLFGVTAVAASWTVLRLWWITAGVAILVSLWWLLFLVLVPAGYRQQAADAQDC